MRDARPALSVSGVFLRILKASLISCWQCAMVAMLPAWSVPVS